MIDRDINEFIRLVGSLSLDRSGKQRVVDFLNQNISNRKEIPAKYFVAASAVVFLAVGTYFLTQSTKQDFNIL